MTVTPLSLRLREGTKASHRLAESSPFIRAFFAGRLTRASYGTFLVQLRQVYAALEAHLKRHQDHPVVGPMYLPELHRVAALDRDLAHYYGDDRWQAQPPHPATEQYVARLDALAAADPAGLVAHHYTRYLGDLSGGQALKRIVAKMFPDESGAGLAFYEFPAIADHGQFKDAYRARLDALPLDEAAGQALVDEANRAFELNRDVFAGMLEGQADAT